MYIIDLNVYVYTYFKYLHIRKYNILQVKYKLISNLINFY